MSIKLLALVVFSLLALPSQSFAAMLHYDLPNCNLSDGDGDYLPCHITFHLPVRPVPDYWEFDDHGGDGYGDAMFRVNGVPGKLNGKADSFNLFFYCGYYEFQCGGGFGGFDVVSNLEGLVIGTDSVVSDELFSGTVDAPTMSKGVFYVSDMSGNLDFQSMWVTVTSAPAPGVPALLFAAFGILAFVRRSKTKSETSLT